MYIVRTPYHRDSEDHWQAQSRIRSCFCGLGGKSADLKWLQGLIHPTGERWHFWRVSNERDALMLQLACGDEIKLQEPIKQYGIPAEVKL